METNRLIIRRANISDLEIYSKIRNSYFVLKYNAMKEQSKDEVLVNLKKYSESNNVFFLDSKFDNMLIGAVFFSEDDLRYGVNSLTMSYFMDEHYSAKGYMYEAIKEILKEIFIERDIEIISARAFSENTYSIKLLKKLGFVQEGYLRRCVKGYNDIIYDDTIFSMFKGEQEFI